MIKLEGQTETMISVLQVGDSKKESSFGSSETLGEVTGDKEAILD